VMCQTKAAVEEARDRVGAVLTRLGLELHPETSPLTKNGPLLLGRRDPS